MKGKSTDTALHEIVSTVEKSLKFKEYTLGIFLDIEGAFNNITTAAIKEALVEELHRGVLSPLFG